jgi:N-methylhydantoinase A
MSIETRPVRVGTDIGGTFTDLEIFDSRKRQIKSHKVPTTPEDPSIGLMTGLNEAGTRFGFELSDIGYLLHGTTIATNAVLQRKFPNGALVTTSGFEDVLEIGRHSRREIYSVKPRPAPPLISRNHRIGIAERIGSNGVAEKPLTEAALDQLVAKLATLNVSTIAVSLLNAYVNPEHEQRIAVRLARDLPDIAITLSSDVSPEIREYERTNTTALNALLIPVVKAYLDRLQLRMQEHGLTARLLIVQSNGAVCSPETAAREPVRLLLSGPSGGALGSLTIAKTLSEPSLVSVDMGGTSFDVSVVRDNRIDIVTQGEIDRVPVRIPMIEIRTIGAGGGSIARVDKNGRITVGPESAGARPGPVCYSRGGTEPTVTDANLVLGRLDPDYFLGGVMPLDLGATRNAINVKVATPLGLDLERAAGGIIAITNTGLAAAIRLSLFEKGLDPRDFALLSFGGAGSIHACAVADELNISRVIFPTNASTFSAWGILHSNIGHDFARSRVMPFDAQAIPVIAGMVAAMREQAASRLAEDGIADANRMANLSADLRYKGQAFELNVPWPSDVVDAATLEQVTRSFHELHLQRFSYSNPGDPMEIVTIRLKAIGLLSAIEAEAIPPSALVEEHGKRRVCIDGKWRDLAVRRRDGLMAGENILGPAVIEEDYTTILIGDGWSAIRGPYGHLLAKRSAKP